MLTNEVPEVTMESGPRRGGGLVLPSGKPVPVQAAPMPAAYYPEIPCLWTGRTLQIVKTALGYLARGDFWSTRLFETPEQIVMALRLKKGLPMSKAPIKKPRLVCPYTMEALAVTEVPMPSVASNNELLLTCYQVRGPFWMTRLYHKRDNLLWDISQVQGRIPTFPRDMLEIIGVREEPEVLEAPSIDSATRAAIEETVDRVVR